MLVADFNVSRQKNFKITIKTEAIAPILIGGRRGKGFRPPRPFGSHHQPPHPLSLSPSPSFSLSVWSSALLRSSEGLRGPPIAITGVFVVSLSFPSSLPPLSFPVSDSPSPPLSLSCQSGPSIETVRGHSKPYCQSTGTKFSFGTANLVKDGCYLFGLRGLVFDKWL